MTAKEFFFLVANMRAAQKSYFKSKDDRAFRAARALENDVDREIARVKNVLAGPPTIANEGRWDT